MVGQHGTLKWLGQGLELWRVRDMATDHRVVLVDSLPRMRLGILLGVQQLVAPKIPLFCSEHSAKFVVQLLCWFVNSQFCWLNIHFWMVNSQFSMIESQWRGGISHYHTCIQQIVAPKNRLDHPREYIYIYILINIPHHCCWFYT